MFSISRKNLLWTTLILGIQLMMAFYFWTRQPLGRPFDGSLSCAEVIETLRSQNPQEVIEALQVLKSKRPDFFKNYVFVAQSRSLQGASFENPRAIVFGEDAKTILTFNGSSDQKGFERLELMCFDDIKKNFSFREIVFPKEAPNEKALTDIPEFKRKQNFLVSPVGGFEQGKCFKCHSKPLRPIWDTYSLWPGVCHSHGLEKHWNQREIMGKKCAPFLNKKWQGRYGVLDQKEKDKDSIFLLGLYLSKWNIQRVVAELEPHRPTIEKNRFRIAQILFCQNQKTDQLANTALNGKARDFFLGNINNYVDRLRRVERSYPGVKILKNRNEQKLVESLSQNYHFNPKNVWEEAALLDVSTSIQEVIVLAKLYEKLSPLNLSISQWSMSLGGGYGHENGIKSLFGDEFFPGYFGELFIQTFFRDQPRLQSLIEEVKAIDYQPAYDPEKYKPNLSRDLVEKERALLCAELARGVQEHKE